MESAWRVGSRFSRLRVDGPPLPVIILRTVLNCHLFFLLLMISSRAKERAIQPAVFVLQHWEYPMLYVALAVITFAW